MILAVKVMPNAPKNEIVGWEEGRLKVRIRAVAEKGKANAELLAFLAKTLGLAKSDLEIVSGETARLKRVRIQGMTEEALRQKIL